LTASLSRAASFESPVDSTFKSYIMANSIIDSKTDKNSFGSILRETIAATITLVQTGPGTFGLGYEFMYSGIKSGNTSSDQPIAVSGNGTAIANPDPKVTYTIANYSDSGTYISMQVTIVVDIPVLGTKTIFNETLGGAYGTDNLKLMVKYIAEISK
jgi:hypothetical protein